METVEHIENGNIKYNIKVPYPLLWHKGSSYSHSDWYFPVNAQINFEIEHMHRNILTLVIFS